MSKYNHSTFLYILLLLLNTSCFNSEVDDGHRGYYHEKYKSVTIVDGKSKVTSGLKDSDFQNVDYDTVKQLVGSQLSLNRKIALNATKVFDLMLKSQLTQNLNVRSKINFCCHHSGPHIVSIRELLKEMLVSWVSNKYAKNDDEYIIYHVINGLTEKYENINNQYILTDFTYKNSGVDFHLDRDNGKVTLSSELGDLEIDTNNNCFGKKKLDLDELFTILNKIYFGHERKQEFELTDLESPYFMALFESFVTNSKCKFIYPKNGYFNQNFYYFNGLKINNKKDYIRVRDLIKGYIKKDLVSNPTKKVYITKLSIVDNSSSYGGISTSAKESLNTKLNDILEKQNFDSKDEIITLLNDLSIFANSLRNYHAILMCYFVDIDKIILVDSNELGAMKNLDVNYLSCIDRDKDTLISSDSYGYQQNGNICNIASSINAILFAELVEQKYETIIKLIKDTNYDENAKYYEIGYLFGDVHKKYRKQLNKIFISSADEFEQF